MKNAIENIAQAEFVGKYAFNTQDGQYLISLTKEQDKNDIVMAAGNTNAPADNQQFNLYGDLTSGFIMQGPNWEYLSYGDDYVSNKKRNDISLSQFSFVTIDNFNVYIVESVSGVDYYLNVNGMTLERIPKNTTTPPDTAKFAINKITDSVADMKRQKSTLGNPLTGVYLSHLDLTKIAFMATDLSYADFTSAKLSENNLNGCTAQNTIFDDADLSLCVANGLTFTNCSFVKTNMQYIKLNTSILNGCVLNLAQFNAPTNPNNYKTNLQQADFTDASMVGCQFGNALVNNSTYKGATLINTDFTNAVGVETIVDFSDALLIGSKLTGHDLTKIKMNSNTNFMGAQLDHCDFTGHDLTDVVFAKASMQFVKLDHTILDGAQLAFADLTSATITGAVSMIGSNLSNAIMQSIQCPGAQLGAKKTLQKLSLSDMGDLNNGHVPASLTGLPLKIPSNSKVLIIQPSSIWRILTVNQEYQVNKNGNFLLVQETTATSNAAILSNAYMPNANFEQANMYAVELSGAHWYGASASAKSADLSLANFSNANVLGMVFTQALLQGTNFDFANLIGTKFDKTALSPSSDLKPTSFAFAMMQSTEFIETNVNFANLTNAAYALDDGVPLFNIDANYKIALDSETLDSKLKDLFTNNGYGLSAVAKVQVNTPGKEWMILNTDQNDDSQVGYGNFKLVYFLDENGLESIKINGATPIIILQKNSKGQLQQTPLSFGKTALMLDQMNDDTTCPSGMKLKLLNNHLSFSELMTAALPPSPPVCSNCWG
ncbi:pentapeptide repeat-containing protein [Psychroserpens sp. BH13MA-6]